jgi:2-keto-3-deoxy-L-arabinonate dehydratase
MAGGGYPDGIRAIVDAYSGGDIELAENLYQRWLPLINYKIANVDLPLAKR